MSFTYTFDVSTLTILCSDDIIYEPDIEGDTLPQRRGSTAASGLGSNTPQMLETTAPLPAISPSSSTAVAVDMPNPQQIQGSSSNNGEYKDLY